MRFSVSIVSHCSGALLPALLTDLRRTLPNESELLLTFNVPEDESFLGAFGDLPIRILRNDKPKGFGANHNQAFAASRGAYFLIVNPDVRLSASPFHSLMQPFVTSCVGACAPRVMSLAGAVEDSVRRYPTVLRLVKRVLMGSRNIDYKTELATPVDWAAGMFVMFRREAFEAVGGFDERYFMYFEDVDLCRRLQQAGWVIIYHPGTSIIHDARRASHRQADHLRWHIRSAIRYLLGI
jgi:hypothetical protein